MTWPDYPSKRRTKRWRYAPVWHAAVRANQLLRLQRRANATLRGERALANAKYEAERVLRREAEAERDRARRLVVAMEAGVDWASWERSMREGER